jgi:acyl carrier protein
VHTTAIQSNAEIVTAFIRERFLYDRPDVYLTPELPILEQRIIDSLQLIQLVQFLQERFAINIDITELVVENFSSIEVIAALVAKHHNQLGSP